MEILSLTSELGFLIVFMIFPQPQTQVWFSFLLAAFIKQICGSMNLDAAVVPLCLCTSGLNVTVEVSGSHISGAEPAREHLVCSSHFLLPWRGLWGRGFAQGPVQGTAMH